MRAYRLLAPLLRGFARRVFLRFGASAENVEDIVQETLLAMHLKQHTWIETRPLLPWIRIIAYNKLMDQLRRSGRGQHVPIDAFVRVAVESPSVASGLDADIAIGKLKGQQREVLVAMSLEGQSAKVAELTEGHVRVVLHRALCSLSKALRNDQS